MSRSAGLHDPGSLPDAEIVQARIEQARRAGESVLVLGDFDADGLTGLAILAEALRWLGVVVEPYVPHRTAEGHGLSLAAVARAREAGHTLIITADTGSTSVAEVAAARQAGIDVIVTDHHVLGSQLPDAVALVNLQRPDSHYPDRRLSGAGVAFKVAQLLMGGQPGGAAAALGAGGPGRHRVGRGRGAHRRREPRHRASRPAPAGPCTTPRPGSPAGCSAA